MGKVKAHRHVLGLRPGQVVDADSLDAGALKVALKNGAVERVGKDTEAGVDTREAPEKPAAK